MQQAMTLQPVPPPSAQQFLFEDRHRIRVLERGDEPWFVAADVCGVLEIANSRDAIARLDEDEKDVATIDTPGGPQRMTVVNESGLYAVILTSRKPEAKAFKRWITHEVIPAIRKQGAYLAPSMTPGELLVAMANRFLDQEREIEALKLKQTEQDERIADIELRQTAMEHGAQYFTVVGFASRCGRHLDNAKAQALGKYAARYSRKHGYPIGEAPDFRYGKVNTYHVEALRAVFGIGEQ